MTRKTKIHAEEGKQELRIVREFNLPMELLFKAYIDPEIIEQWMGTKVLKQENRKHGSWRYETTDPMGNKHGFNGVIHEFIPQERIVRTFEMENAPFPPQLEFLEFTSLTDDASKLEMHVIYRSVSVRDEILKLPFAQGIDMAHSRLQRVMENLK